MLQTFQSILSHPAIGYSTPLFAMGSNIVFGKILDISNPKTLAIYGLIQSLSAMTFNELLKLPLASSYASLDNSFKQFSIKQDVDSYTDILNQLLIPAIAIVIANISGMILAKKVTNRLGYSLKNHEVRNLEMTKLSLCSALFGASIFLNYQLIKMATECQDRFS